MAGLRIRTIAMAAALCAVALLALPATAFAADLEQLATAYTDAVRGYEDALSEQERNAQQIAELETEIQANEQATARSQNELGQTASALYKGMRGQTVLVDLLMGSSSFQDAVKRYEMYEKVADYCVDRIGQLRSEQERLTQERAQLEQRKQEIEEAVAAAKQAAEQAEQALLDASHADGAEYHQRQGNGVNCGATSFIVAVNMLLHENRFTDNVAVWEGAGFNGDSTQDLAYKGWAWLLANGLSGEIGIEYVPGDIHTTAELFDQLNQGNVIVMSSGPGSVWQRADGTETEPDVFPDGHYAVFYRCEGGVFFCNDSSVSAELGAGCAYTEAQMQQWLDGRSNHFAVALYKK